VNHEPVRDMAERVQVEEEVGLLRVAGRHGRARERNADGGVDHELDDDA